MKTINLPVVKKAREEFKIPREDNKNACALVGFVNKAGLFVSNNTACHASMSYPEHILDNTGGIMWCSPEFAKSRGGVKKEDRELVAIISSFQDPYNGGTWKSKGITPQMLLDYVEWMLKESPWKTCFLNPSAQDVIDNNWLINVDENYRLVTNACFATRLCSEFPQRFHVWHVMYKNGFSGAESWIAAMMIKSKSKDTFPVHIVIGSGHLPFGDMTKTAFLNFTNNTPDFRATDRSYKEMLTYRDVNAIWHGLKGYDGPHYRAYEKIRPIVAYKQENLDIFYQNKARDGGFEFHNIEELKSCWDQVKQILLK